jgi:hypothetical protein
MTTKPPLQKILPGILHTENESKQNHERTGSTKPQEKTKNQSTLKQQKNLNDRNHNIPINTNAEC